MTPTSNNAPLLSTLESYLKLTATREQSISANMANVDTPGYHTRDINFEGELQKAMSTNVNEASTGGFNAQLTPVVQDVPGLIERPDGNNVSLDREGLMMAQTQLQYQIGIQLIKHHFHGLITAINGGN
jgi:flagellar basal-body rod protein FlgB